MVVMVLIIVPIPPFPTNQRQVTHQNLLFCRVPVTPIVGFIIRTDRKVVFGRIRYSSGP